MTRARVLSCGNEEVVFWTGEITFIRLKMAKMLTLVAFLVGISCALAESGSSESMEPLASTPVVGSQTPTPTPSPSPSPSPSPLPSPSPSPSLSSIPPHTSTPMPSPSPSPSPVPDETYKFVGPDGSVCIHMKAGLEVTVNYTIENGTNSTVLNQLFRNLRVDNSTSFCNTTYARLVLAYTANPNFNFTFTFNDTTKNVTWQDGNTTFQYEPTTTYLPGYNGHFRHDKMDFGDGVLFGRQNIEMQRSYKCDGPQYFNGSGELTNHTVNATLTVTDLQVQVFQFLKNASNGTFDEARNCANGNTSKIVPIAVGAALAGLVIVVLIAYLIGRFRNRKQSSYEALS